MILLFITSLLLLTGCGAGVYSSSKQMISRDSVWSIPIAPKSNLYKIDDMLYRSEQLKSQDIEILRQQGIQSIINLRYFDRDDDQEHFSEQGFTLINKPLKIWSVKAEQLADILHQINLQQRYGHKVLVHCYHGADRTGVTIAIYRIIRQGWTIEQAKSEMLYGGYGYHPIWINLEKLLTTEKVAKIREELSKLEHNEVNFSYVGKQTYHH